jgi:type IV pilus assembly protein PilM
MALNVGLDIGTTAVRAAVIQTGRGKPKLRKYGQVALPEGTVVGGEIVDEAIMRDALSELWKSAKLPKKRIVVGLANQRVIVRRIDIEYMDEEQLAEALPFQAQEYIPIPVDEAILDFVPLEEFTTPDGQAMLSVLVVAAQRSMADDLLRMVNQAVGGRVLAMDLQAFGLVRAAQGADEAMASGTAAIVDIGGGITQVSVVKDGTVRFLRILGMGGDAFTEVLREDLDLGLDQADQLKRRVGVAPDEPEADESEDGRARRALTRMGDQLIDEIRGSIDYYLSQSNDTGVDTVYISGNGARLPHLANRMARVLDVGIQPVRLLDSEFLDVSKTGLSETELMASQPVLPVAAGLGLWGEE